MNKLAPAFACLSSDCWLDPIPELDKFPCPLVGTDSKGIINLINQPAEQLTGKRTHYLGQPVEALQKIWPSLPRLVSRTLLTARQICHVEHHDDKHWAITTHLQKTPSGVVASVLIVFQNITFYCTQQRKHYQHEMLLLLEHLTGQTAHGIRNPLTTIKGFIQLYRSEPGSLPWDLLEEEIRSIEMVIGQLLAFSSRHPQELTTVNINQMVCELCPEIEARARAQGVWVQLTLPPHLRPMTAEIGKVKTLLAQLCHNALDAMPHGGVLSMITAQKGRHLIFQVTDTGTGIEPDHLPRIFEPFFTTRPNKTGLGLAICHQIVSGYQGSIKINSRVSGTTVTVSLPQSAKI
ncbi:MAG: two-component system sensor histidine kinase NtrB [Syntrophothermaceae bacterium]|jgi:two-component system sensor histidine kinase AtoS